MTKSELINLLDDISTDGNVKVFMRDETHYLWAITDVVLDSHGIAIYFDYDDPLPPDEPA